MTPDLASAPGMEPAVLTTRLLQVAVLCLFPAAARAGARRYRVLGWLSPVVLCYLLGMLWGNLAPGLVDGQVARLASEVTVVLAIPLLLFGTDFVRWLRLARSTVLSFGLALVAVVAVSAAGALLFADLGPRSADVAGMLVGVYTGGTLNMSAIKLALGVPDSIFLVVHAADVALGSLLYMLLITVGPRVARALLPAFAGGAGDGPRAPEEQGPGRFSLPAASAALGLAVVVVGLSLGAALLVTGRAGEAAVILLVTSLSIAASFVPRVRGLREAGNLGDYVLLIFCLAVGSRADFQAMLQAGSTLFLYVALVMYGSAALHYLLAWLLRIDADTAMITSTAAIYGPAFVPPVARVLQNQELIVSGLTTSLVGLAAGNYLGLGVARAIGALLGQ